MENGKVDYRRLLALAELPSLSKPQSRAVMGFDGFVDKIVRVRRDRSTDSGEDALTDRHYKTLAEFVRFLGSKDGLSFSVELETQEEKKGGNMPLTANALGSLGVEVHCLGALGAAGVVDARFASMSDNCVLYPIVDPGWCLAMEFVNTKLMVYDNHRLNFMNWNLIKNALGLGKIIDIFEQSELIGLFNWSEVRNSQDIWDGLISEVLPLLSRKADRNVFIDVSDCTGRKPEDIRTLSRTITGLARSSPVTLSMNENEFLHLYTVLTGRPLGEERIGKERCMGLFPEMREKIPGVSLILHLADSALSMDADGTPLYIPGRFVENPAILIGGGDNFNAGFCFGLLNGEDVGGCMALAGAVGSYYVEFGRSPDRKELYSYLARTLELACGGAS